VYHQPSADIPRAIIQVSSWVLCFILGFEAPPSALDVRTGGVGPAELAGIDTVIYRVRVFAVAATVGAGVHSNAGVAGRGEQLVARGAPLRVTGRAFAGGPHAQQRRGVYAMPRRAVLNMRAPSHKTPQGVAQAVPPSRGPES